MLLSVTEPRDLFIVVLDCVKLSFKKDSLGHYEFLELRSQESQHAREVSLG